MLFYNLYHYLISYSTNPKTSNSLIEFILRRTLATQTSDIGNFTAPGHHNKNDDWIRCIIFFNLPKFLLAKVFQSDEIFMKILEYRIKRP